MKPIYSQINPIKTKERKVLSMVELYDEDIEKSIKMYFFIV
jgi:hypothetical protein